MRLALTQPVQLLAGIRGVRPADLPREVMAGVTLAALAIPLNIGYAQVAGLPPAPACTRPCCRWWSSRCCRRPGSWSLVRMRPSRR